MLFLTWYRPPILPSPHEMDSASSRQEKKEEPYIGNRREGEALSCLLIATRYTFPPTKRKKEKCASVLFRRERQEKNRQQFPGGNWKAKRAVFFLLLGPSARWALKNGRQALYSSLFSFLGRWWLLVCIAHICFFGASVEPRLLPGFCSSLFGPPPIRFEFHFGFGGTSTLKLKTHLVPLYTTSLRQNKKGGGL